MILTLAAFVQLAAACGPAVHVDTLASVAQTESQLDTLAIHDNVTGRTFHPATHDEAVRIATDLVNARRHSTDLGLMQINSSNLPALDLALADSFDACKSIAAGARILAAGYRPAEGGNDAQHALKQALSRYNTGHPDRGFANGYVRRVQLAANQIVPAIHLDTASPGEPKSDAGEGVSSPAPAAPPTWDVYGQARYQRERNSGGVEPSSHAQATLVAPVDGAAGSAIAPAVLDRAR